jgi:uncharacterized protein YdaU (DUF1376 family)
MAKKKKSSGKSPAVLFYPNDWLGSTMGMSFEERGAYFHILMMQFNVGHMTSHMVGQAVGQLWGQIQHKFVQDEKGLWYNKRMEKEIITRQDYVNSRNNNALGKNQYTKNEENKEGHMGGHMTPHMENENIISTISNSVSRNTEVLELNIREKKEFNKKPCFEDVREYPENKKYLLVEFAKIAKQADITNEQIDAYWKIFKLQSLTGENYYNSESKVYEHFLNWFKKQDFKSPQISSTANGKPRQESTSTVIPKFSKSDTDKYSDYQ